MPWNWELDHWPHFTYDNNLTAAKEKQFLLKIGSALAYLKTIKTEEYREFVVEILCTEGIESSKIEGEYLDRESLQSSIQQHFGLKGGKKSKKEAGMGEILCDVYEKYDQPLTHEMMFKWHKKLFSDSNLADIGQYRTHKEPMQIVSNRLDSKKVFFEASPSEKVYLEMDNFIKWFNSSKKKLNILERAAILHVYFESIHPFEDGNGRIGRLLVEKVLSQEVDTPLLISLSKILEKRKKEYYQALERCNKALEISQFLIFFSEAIIQAQEESLSLLYFLIGKSKLMNSLSGHINPRQEKVLLRMFKEGLSRFKGGLSADNYISITKTSRATATRDLQDLVQKGALIKKGELKHSRYYLNIN